MTLVYIILAVILLLLLVVLFFIVKPSGPDSAEREGRIEQLNNEIRRVEESVRSEIAANRRENNEQSALGRKELQLSLLTFEEKLNHLTQTIDQQLRAFGESGNNNAAVARREIKEALEVFKKDLSQSIMDFNRTQKENFFALLGKQSEQNTQTGASLESMRLTLEKKITDMQQGNEQKLEQMRITVDEKLQQTLEARLGESFKLVSERLEAVHKGLGDMQTLATGVGDLKRVLSNVKTRGVLGEYQLESLLEQILTPEQYDKNVRTKANSSGLVEFAVKLPGRRGTEDQAVWLPIDSKFPKEAFELLTDAYEQGNPERIEEQRRNFIRGIRVCAQDISSKYIDAPHTTDFAILFLPFESLYAEVLRTPGLFESIKREYNVVINGPTTLSAFLSSLQMGFHTLAIEKRSSEVWQLLGAVKTEFGNFAGLLDKAQKNIQTGLNQLEDVVGVRTRAIQKRLKGVDTLPEHEARQILPAISPEDGDEEE